MEKTKEGGRKAFASLIARLATGRTVIGASKAAADDMQARRDRFDVERAQIEESIDDGARLTKHRITL